MSSFLEDNVSNVASLGNAQTTSDASLQEDREKFFLYQKAEERIRKLINQFEAEKNETERRRKIRDFKVDRNDLLRRGKLKPDETIIPIRLVDTNITREQPAYVAYLKQSRRIAIFNDVLNPGADTQQIEQEFTRKMTYESWEVPHFKCLDGAQTHGWAALEVEYDPSKPAGVGLAYIAHDDLIFNLDSEDIQRNEMVLVKYNLTMMQLKSYVKDNNFSPEQSGLVLDNKNELNEDRTTVVYKVYFKFERVVYVAWCCINICNDWLKAPTKLFLGVREKQEVPPQVSFTSIPSPQGFIPIPQAIPQPPIWSPVDETEYPIEILSYSITEQKKISSGIGRTTKDEHKQEAVISVWSNFINALNRAAGVYAAPSNPVNGGSPKQTDTIVESGRIYSEPLNLWNFPYPDPIMLKAAQAIDVQNSQETGQVNFAAQNREDSRKTATEIAAASKQGDLLNSVQVTLYSTHIRRTYTRVWRVVKSLALQEKVIFLPIQMPSLNPMTGQMEMKTSNNLPEISKQYELRAAGDVDVIQRDEKLQRLQQIWPIAQSTPLAMLIFIDLLKIMFPDDASRYEQFLNNALAQMQAMPQQTQQPGDSTIGNPVQNQPTTV